MATLRDELRADSAALLSISTHAKEFVDSRRAERTYLAETDAFFRYIDRLLQSLCQSVGEVVAQSATAREATLAADLRDIKALELVIGQLYRFVRQVSDADTLTIPFPIIAYINNVLLGQFPDSSGVNKSKILLLATDELNFLHRRLDKLRITIQQCTLVPPLPSNLGIIAFPYTERNSICLNSLLFHELGHFVYQQGKLDDRFGSDLQNLDSRVEAIPRQKLLFGEPVMRSLARERVLSWCQELFADLLATIVIGPSYAIAFDRLVRLKGVGTQNRILFSERHPADTFRKAAISQLLDHLGWIRAIEAVDKANNRDLLDLIQSDAATSPKYDCLFGNRELGTILVDTFCTLSTGVLECAKELSVHLPSQIDDFTAYYSAITQSLTHLVVPDVVRTATGTTAPSPATILICGSLVLRQDLASVFTLCERNPDNIEHQLWIEDRISRLVLKGMEDTLILDQWHEL